MIKRLIALLSITVLLLATNAGVAAATHPTHSTTDTNSTTDAFWAGFWAGYHFSANHMNGQSAPPPTPTSPSNSSSSSITTATTSSTTTTTPSAPPPVTPNTYMALGDSIAAGAGLPPGPNATEADIKCGRSPAAYPYRVAQARGMTLIHFACSGAKTSDVNRSKQLKAAFASGTPGLVTVTSGANDARWTTFLKKCYSTRCGTENDTRIVANYQEVLRSRLHTLLTNIRQQSGDRPPTVVLTGYYNPLSTDCSRVEPRFSTLEMAWVSEQLGILNETIKSVSAQYPFAKFAPISFAGHDVCSSDPWVQGRTDKAPFHPTAEGQQIIANQILRVL